MSKMLLLHILILIGCSTDPDKTGDMTSDPESGSVAYVDSNGTSNTVCSLTKPCAYVSEALETERSIIHIHGTIYEKIVMSEERSVTLLGDEAIIASPDGLGPLLYVTQQNTEVRVKNVTFTGVTDQRYAAIQMDTANPSLSLTHVIVEHNAGRGIVVYDGSLTLSRSMIIDNTSGGLDIDNNGGFFVVVGNVFVDNGWQNSFVGGISIIARESGLDKLEFNTIYRNTAETGNAPAIFCSLGNDFVIRNNIIVDNVAFDSLDQINGCSYEYTLSSVKPLQGKGNFSEDPMFIDVSRRDYHLRLNSPAIGAADPTTDLRGETQLDLDDQQRTKPASVGAYEY